MNIIYIQHYIQDQEPILNHLLNYLDWLEISKARKEYFMAHEKLSYTYGGAKSGERTYVGNHFTTPVLDIMNRLNNDFGCNYDVCILNRYDGQHNSLGWHSDNSPEMNTNHPEISNEEINNYIELASVFSSKVRYLKDTANIDVFMFKNPRKSDSISNICIFYSDINYFYLYDKVEYINMNLIKKINRMLLLI
jgi:hypothetical protein